MSLLYTSEHLACFNYSKQKNPAIEYQNLSKGEVLKFSSLINKFVFILKGCVHVSFGAYYKQEITANKIVILPAGYQCHVQVKEDTDIAIFRMDSQMQLCDQFSLEHLLAEGTEEDVALDLSNKLYCCEINEIVRGYLNCLEVYISSGLKCIHFFDLKTKELLFLIRAYYPKKELYYFFYPVLTHNLSFSDFIQRNYRKAKNVNDLAALSCYSLSGFHKHFKKVFGISPYQWMSDQRAKEVFHGINDSKKSLKEICDEYDFSSPAHLNAFCKTHFGKTPGLIRKAHKKAE